jgi:hypothetical protein
MFRVSQSKVKAWRQCRQQYHYREVEGLRRKKPSRPLTFGSLVHELLDVSINGGDWLKRLKVIEKRDAKLFQAGREEYGDIVNDTRTIMTEYFETYSETYLKYISFENKLAEHVFEVPLTKGIMLKGKIDGFAEMHNGLKALVEHKTFNYLPSEDHRWRNVQSGIYHHVARELGVKLDGTLWDYIRSKPPTVPVLLKDGSTSMKEVDTLPTVVRAVLKERNQSEKLYAALLRKAEESRKKWFHRVFNRRRDEVVKILTSDFVETAKEMQKLHGVSQTMTIDRHCEWCQFEPLCRAKIQGHDVDFIKRGEYRVEEDQFDYHEERAEA